MSFQSNIRNQAWRSSARTSLHVWKTSFDHVLSQISKKELRQIPPNSEYMESEEIPLYFSEKPHVYKNATSWIIVAPTLINVDKGAMAIIMLPRIKQLVLLIKMQLDEDMESNCTPFGKRGSYGAPFKITCKKYG
jgi:hypothetical protein